MVGAKTSTTYCGGLDKGVSKKPTVYQSRVS